jgi:hypothetical protein
MALVPVALRTPRREFFPKPAGMPASSANHPPDRPITIAGVGLPDFLSPLPRSSARREALPIHAAQQKFQGVWIEDGYVVGRPRLHPPHKMALAKRR